MGSSYLGGSSYPPLCWLPLCNCSIAFNNSSSSEDIEGFEGLLLFCLGVKVGLASVLDLYIEFFKALSIESNILFSSSLYWDSITSCSSTSSFKLLMAVYPSAFLYRDRNAFNLSSILLF